MKTNVEKFRKKIEQVNNTLLDAAEALGVHMLINVTVVDGDRFLRNMCATKGMTPTDIAYASLGQSANTFNCITQKPDDDKGININDIPNFPGEL